MSAPAQLLRAGEPAGAGAGLWAVVPVKAFTRTKRRLAAALDPAQRAALAQLMLGDVLEALLQARGLAGVLVVTGDAAAARMALAAGAGVLHEELHDADGAGTAAAVALAARRLAAEGRAGMLVVPADVPAITAADVEALIAAHAGRHTAPAVTLVPATADGGTNALVCSPPDALPPCFGEDSFRRHLAAARACGAEPVVVELPGLGQDIDRPEDLERFRNNAAAGHSRAWHAVQQLPVWRQPAGSAA